MTVSPRPGGLRKGTRFEMACQDLFETLGYTTIFENWEFPCKHPKKHKKDPHEIDFLSKFQTVLFLKPWCSKKRPLVECTSSLKKPSTRADRKKLVKQITDKIECVRDYGYEVDCGIIATNSTLPGFSKLSKSVFIWDQPRMTFYAYKVFELKKLESTVFPAREMKINDEASFLWATQKHEKQEQYLHRIVAFFDKTIRKRQSAQVNMNDLRSAIQHIKGEITKRKLYPGTIYADFFSIRGFTRSIYEKRDTLGNKYSTSKITIMIERALDCEITPWWALIR